MMMPMHDTCYRLKWPSLKIWRRLMQRCDWSRHFGSHRKTGPLTMNPGSMWVTVTQTQRRDELHSFISHFLHIVSFLILQFHFWFPPDQYPLQYYKLFPTLPLFLHPPDSIQWTAAWHAQCAGTEVCQDSLPIRERAPSKWSCTKTKRDRRGHEG